jgi:hypothetical protein
VFIILFITSALPSQEPAVFGFFIFFSLFLSSAGFTLLIFTSRVIHWIVKILSPSYRAMYKSMGWSEEQMDNDDSIMTIWSKSGIKFNTKITKLIGLILTFLGTIWFFSFIIIFLSYMFGTANIS